MVTVQKSTQHVLTAVDYSILQLTHQYHFLSASQITRIKYSAGSATTAQDRLKRLFDAGVLDRLQLPAVGSGNSAYLYTLGRLGRKALQEIGIETFTRYRPGDTQTLRLPHLQHLISLNDFLIAAQLLSRVHPDITLVHTLHDLDMKRTPIHLTLDRQVVSIVPDGFLDFRLSIAGRLFTMPIWIELDRGTTWGNTLKVKLQKIISAINTLAFQDLFGVSSVTVAIATTDKRRVDLMRSFIQAELQRLGLLHLATVFLFTPLPEKLEPIPLFTAPVWQTIQGDYVSLLDLSEN